MIVMPELNVFQRTRAQSMTRHFNRSEYKQSRQAARASMPPAEAILWSKLNHRQLLGCKFRRQFGVDGYRLDFYSPGLKLGIELDGESHTRGEALDRDVRRDRHIESLGIRILRIWNAEIFENLDGVWDAIVRVALEQLSRHGGGVPGRRMRRGATGLEAGEGE
jgi:very-short-patch-repair endonuclease